MSEGNCFVITSFAQVETGTHYCVYFQNSALVMPQPLDPCPAKYPQIVSMRGCGGKVDAEPETDTGAWRGS